MKKSLVTFLLLFLIHISNCEIGYFWQVSDPHIDYHYKENSDPDNCHNEIMCCRYQFQNQTRKVGKFGEAVVKPKGIYCDTPLITLQKGFEFITDYSNTLNPKPDFMLIAGDYTDHGADLPNLQNEETILRDVKIISDLAETAARKISSSMKVFPSIGVSL
jgi:3',5'-cyclic AMP phosphodiesterase CpdA